MNSALLADLGLAGSTPVLAALTDVNNGGGGGSYTVTESAEIDLTSAVPEPRTWLMMTLGMSLIAFSAQRRFSRSGQEAVA